MSRASNGIYTLPNTVNPVVAGTTITVDWANTTLGDIEGALTESLDRNGKGSMLAPLLLPAGAVGTPALSFTAENVTGLFRKSAGVIGVSVGGVEVMTLSAAGIGGTASKVEAARVLTGPSTGSVDSPTLYAQGANTTTGTRQITVRERNLGGAQSADQGAAPSLSFYWSGRTAAQLTWSGESGASGAFQFYSENRTSYVSGKFAFVFVGQTGVGLGGNIKYLNDAGGLQWTAGVLGSAGATDWSVFNAVAGRTDFRINTSGQIFGLGDKLTVRGRDASDLRLAPINAGWATGEVRVHTVGALEIPANLEVGGIYAIYSAATGTVALNPASGVLLVLAGTALQGSRVLAPTGFVVVWVRAANSYVISGSGLS